MPIILELNIILLNEATAAVQKSSLKLSLISDNLLTPIKCTLSSN